MEIIELNPTELDKVKKIELNILLEFDRICRKNNLKYSLAYGTLLGAVRHKGFIPWDDDIDVYMPREDYIKFSRIAEQELGDKYFYQSNDTDKEYYHLFNKIRANGTVFRESFLSEYNIHHGVYMDIFPLDIIPDNPVKKNIQYLLVSVARTALLFKYLCPSARKGIKRKLAQISKVIFSPFSVKVLYDFCMNHMQKYNKTNAKMYCAFCVPFGKREIFRKDNFENLIQLEFEQEYKFYAMENYDQILTAYYGDYMKYPPEEKRKTVHTLTDLKLE